MQHPSKMSIGGSSPSLPVDNQTKMVYDCLTCGCNSTVESQPSKLLVARSNRVIRFPSRDLFLCSSAVEPSTVNRLVAGSNPAGGVGWTHLCEWEYLPPFRAISAVVAHLLYTERVGGSNPSSPIINKIPLN